MTATPPGSRSPRREAVFPRRNPLRARRPGRGSAAPLLACVLLCLGLLSGGPAFGRDLVEIAKYVPDGDTLVLRTGEAIRLLGIDAPETAHRESEAQHYSDRARDTLRKLIGKRILRIVPGPTGQDRYGRILGLVYLPDGTLVNRELLRRGMAFYYPFPGEEFALGPEFLDVQRQAMDRRAGAWSRVLSMPEAGRPYVGNRASLRFFPADSKPAAKISQRNVVRFENLEAAFRAGYAPARATTPWPLMGKSSDKNVSVDNQRDIYVKNIGRQIGEKSGNRPET